MDAVPISKKLIAFGNKKIFLPKFTVAMVRAPGLSPYHARFLVPLDFSKYDLRDYLYHAYNVKCYNIRSYVKQMPIRDTTSQARHWFRPDSKKYMTVEMEQPFVWPELPADKKAWGIGEQKSQMGEVAMMNGIVTPEERREKAKSLREQVKTLLMKKEPPMPRSIVQKRLEGKPLTPEELQKEEEALRQKADNEKMSATQFWEQRRTMKVVQSDDASDFSIKA
ncbi:mitochondrial ribosomal protein subunit L23 [Didymella exigua CBS 183.55]|uniref:Large ribosomal subunit protein uL23m n=1 Tax=Didymella exigua CBS 183.55 TaxID=1150837 RepID=A0A6A5R8D8_9PLEO|nr:mitochondrial ribosomal protein subunit L23 [Didymella exigua CBS 183.55]KAF1924471.1 mitochondrial ribosomal protein subunit L23 [Didymella exigua CBS 183.55]